MGKVWSRNPPSSCRTAYPAVSGWSSLRIGLDVGVLVGAPHGCGRSRESEKPLVVMSFVVIFSGSGRSQYIYSCR